MIYSHLTHPKLLIKDLTEGDVVGNHNSFLEVVHIKRNRVKWTITWKNTTTNIETKAGSAGKYSFVWEQNYRH